MRTHDFIAFKFDCDTEECSAEPPVCHGGVMNYQVDIVHEDDRWQTTSLWVYLKNIDPFILKNVYFGDSKDKHALEQQKETRII